jgi:hypothetical protein
VRSPLAFERKIRLRLIRAGVEPRAIAAFICASADFPLGSSRPMHGVYLRKSAFICD